MLEVYRCNVCRRVELTRELTCTRCGATATFAPDLVAAVPVESARKITNTSWKDRVGGRERPPFGAFGPPPFGSGSQDHVDSFEDPSDDDDDQDLEDDDDEEEDLEEVAEPVQLSEASSEEESISKTLVRIGYVDRVLSKDEGGLIDPSVIVIGGNPGAGKSTLAVQMSISLASQGKKIFYAVGEESRAQVVARFRRMGEAYPANLSKKIHSNIRLIEDEEWIDDVLAVFHRGKGDFLFVDSLQKYKKKGIDGKRGGVAQSRGVAQFVCDDIHHNGGCAIFLCQMTKDEKFASPMSVEHDVDALFMLEVEGEAKKPQKNVYEDPFDKEDGPDTRPRRFSASTNKNRFGPTLAEGVYTYLVMAEDGLKPLPKKELSNGSSCVKPHKVARKRTPG